MISPTLFSPAVTESLLPEVAGARYMGKALALAEKAGYACELSGYPYPNLAPGPSQRHGTTYLMMEPREKTEAGQPISASEMRQRIRTKGVTSETVRMVCPLVFWSRHVDLALEYGKGDLIFAPWITQGELISLFRTLSVAAGQPETYHDIPLIRDAPEALRELSEQMGNHGLLVSVLALPEDTEWDALQWINTIKALPSRERRVYMDRFGKHLRFLPSQEAFAPLNSYWATTAHACEADASTVGNPWIKRYRPIVDQALTQLREQGLMA